MPTINYLSPGLFDMGGIARYGRYQVRALRELYGSKSVRVLSLLGPEAGGFDEPVDVDVVGGGLSLKHKAKFASSALLGARTRRIQWAGHLHFASLNLACAAVARGDALVNIYGLEVWSSPPRAAVMALRRSWVISDCHATLDEAVRSGMVDPKRATVIWDPVDVATFRPGAPDAALAARYGLAIDGRFRVMFLGRLAKGARHKNPDGLIRAFARARLPANAELVIAGSGDRRDELEALGRELGLGARVRFLGRVPDADLPGLYRLASVFVLVSRRFHGGGEGIPLTPLEAAACGVPIIVGNEDGSREAVVEGQTGFVVASRDDNALSAVLGHLAHDAPAMRRFGEAACERIRDHFSFERFVREHAMFVERIENERR